MGQRTEYLHIRLSKEEKLQVEKLASFAHYSVSQYVSRLISSTYYKFFDKEGNLIEDKEAVFNNKL